MHRFMQLTPVLVVVAYFTVYLLMFESSKPSIVVNVQNDPSLDEMARIIQEQREKIEYLTSHQRVVYRCLDDESKIKYPRQASDDLTETVMETNDECGNTSITDAIVLVHTAAGHFQRRERFRRTYANYSNTRPYRLKVVFLIGSVLSANLKIQLEQENREHGDTVVGAFLDTYQNLTLKAVMGFRWLTNTCSDVKLLIKMDDDVFFDVRKFFSTYWNKASIKNKKNSIHCLVWNNAHVGRTGKWKVEKNLFANASYQFPYCAGFFALVTPDLIPNMYQRGKTIDFFWIDDVFLYGMVPAAIKGVNFVQLGGKTRALTESYKDYKLCRVRADTTKCKFFAAVTDGEKEFDQEYSALFEPQPPALNQTSVNKFQVIQSNQSKPVSPKGGKQGTLNETVLHKLLPESIITNMKTSTIKKTLS